MKPSEAEAAYWKGLMDGAYIFSKGPPDIDEFRKSVAAVRHVCYPSFIGPYCVICHEDVPAPYEPIWSDDETIRRTP